MRDTTDKRGWSIMVDIERFKERQGDPSEKEKPAIMERLKNLFKIPRVYANFCDKSRWGNFKLGRKTSRKKFRQKMTDMNM